MNEAVLIAKDLTVAAIERLGLAKEVSTKPPEAQAKEQARVIGVFFSSMYEEINKVIPSKPA